MKKYLPPNLPLSLLLSAAANASGRRPSLTGITVILLLFVLVLGTAAGCTTAARAPVAMAQNLDDPKPTYILSVPGATPTPTPFQPVPPTPLILPEGVPTLTPASPALTPQVTLSEQEEAALVQPFGQLNILLLGADKRPYSSNFRTDTIILVTINSELGHVNVTSFPRDLYVTVPGWGMQRINTAWTYGKYPLLAQTFKHNFGIQPNYYALIDFSSFKKILDSLGGLTINVSESLSDYRAGYWVTVPKGEVQMDADDILWYVRSRKTTNDFARNRRQQEVLQALFVKLISLNALRRIPEFYDLYQGGVKTDIGLTELLTWLPLAASVAESGNINYYAINYKHVYDYITPYGGWVLLPDRQAVMRIIRKSQNIQ